MKVSLSNMEWKLMNQLWDHAPMTLMQLTRALEEDTGWTKHTIITMLTRLEGKDAVRWEQSGRTRHYSPVIAREDARREETASFLDRVYGGKLGLMMSALVDDHKLTKEDIDELSEILKKAGEGK
ncbi:MAG: BlaI/MecI/CopY family transcriptional regulator [Oscillospiraceae bacterium]|nr:BlaI/MecI/CopY family transcriptional regulator [Oscillospiraceae bacterium]